MTSKKKKHVKSFSTFSHEWMIDILVNVTIMQIFDIYDLVHSLYNIFFNND